MMTDARQAPGPLHTVLTWLAILALIQPLLTPFAPDLAGWSPSHSHVFTGGTPHPHSHPWDHHADGHNHEATGHSAPTGHDARVGFITDWSSTAGALWAPQVAVRLTGPEPILEVSRAVPPRPSSIPTIPDPDPPRA